ncbi:uncharacterized protein RJT20DRAFT_135262 [Scheffersomyces xylosifermentans]|uniref:uncharacterized protein n=1 Tax=Scheffersomyces xylosifermentans TaxID=1304137 RepID=UPI00315C9D63
MSYSTEIISTVLFQSTNVAIYSIPPGELSLSKWDLKESNIIWTGHLRLIEEEVIRDNVDLFASFPDALHNHNQVDASVWDDSGVHGDSHTEDVERLHGGRQQEKRPSKPFECLRAKLELYNEVVIPPGVGSLTSTKKDVIWAETWYNPSPILAEDLGADEYFKIANNGQETIQMTKESSKYYKIIAQLPGSGYHPFTKDNVQGFDDDNGMLLQVALGLKFYESFDNISFSESLNIYKRRFRNFEDQYRYELKLLEIQQKSSVLSINDQPQSNSPDSVDEPLFPLDTGKSRSSPNPVNNMSFEYSFSLGRGETTPNSLQKERVSVTAISESDDDDDDFGDFITS